VSGRREHDAVREARDAFVLVTAATPVAAIAAGLCGVGMGDYLHWQILFTGPMLVAVLLLGTLSSALLLADRMGHRLLGTRPHAIGRVPLIVVALVCGGALVAGIPTTWPVVIGFGLVCLILGLVILIGAAFNL
jgi:peptidoglycan/LPS O-acetylase OafA/YrhL